MHDLTIVTLMKYLFVIYIGHSLCHQTIQVILLNNVRQ